MEPEEITNIEIYRRKLILKQDVFVLHVTSVNIGSVQVTHLEVGARTMHAYDTDLVRNPAIWLVESQDLVIQFAYRGRILQQELYTLTIVGVIFLQTNIRDKYC